MKRIICKRKKAFIRFNFNKFGFQLPGFYFCLHENELLDMENQ